MPYSIFEAFDYSNSHIHIILHNLLITPDLDPPKPDMHWHESMELIYVFTGVCAIHCDTSSTLVHPGELAIIHCNENHKVQLHSSVAQYYCLIIGPSHFNNLPFSVENTYFDRIIKTPFILTLMLRIAHELNTHPQYYEFTVKSLITLLFHELYRQHRTTPLDSNTPSPNDSKTYLVHQVIFYVRTHFTENFSLEDLCQEIGISKYYLCRIFKEITQKTVIQFINEVRCQYAQSLIYENVYTIDEIAERCGFNSTNYFYRTYKKHIGIAPLHTYNKSTKAVQLSKS